MVLHVRMLRRAASGEYDLAPDQLFSTIEQLLFTKVLSIAEKEGKPVRLAVAAANDLWEGILRTAANLQSSTIVAGKFVENARSPSRRAKSALSWERMPEPRPARHAGNLHALRTGTGLLSRPARAAADARKKSTCCTVWLELTDHLPGEEIHHHDIVHFALTEVEREIATGRATKFCSACANTFRNSEAPAAATSSARLATRGEDPPNVTRAARKCSSGSACLQRNRRTAIGAILRGRRSRRRGRVPAVDLPHHQKNHESDDQKIDHAC